MPKPSSPILSPRGFGVGRGDFLNFLLFDRGFGVGRGDVELQIRLPISPILSPRGFGVSRSDANWVPIAIESLRGFGVGRGDAVRLASKLTDPISGDRGFGISKEDAVIVSWLTLPPILSPRGFGVSRSDANRVPVAIESLRGFGAGRPDFRLWGLQEFAYSGSAPDQAGILYFWGTNFAQTTWINPSSRGATFSWSASGSGSASNTADRTSNATNSTTNTANSWVQLDCGATRTIRPVGYYLQHDGTAAGFLQNWKLQGSNNGSTWDDLDTRISDTSLNAANVFAFFSVPGVTTFYRYLRILQTGVNSSGSNTLTLSEWEFYGFFKY